MRILVAGGAGYVGSTSVETFIEAGHDVIVYDDLSTGHARRGDPAAPGSSSASRGPERASSTSCASERIHAVLHCAAKLAGQREHGSPGALLPP